MSLWEAGVLIVAECNVNTECTEIVKELIEVLIVAECNVNVFDSASAGDVVVVLIVAECNVNVTHKQVVHSTTQF